MSTNNQTHFRVKCSNEAELIERTHAELRRWYGDGMWRRAEWRYQADGEALDTSTPGGQSSVIGGYWVDVWATLDPFTSTAGRPPIT